MKPFKFTLIATIFSLTIATNSLAQLRTAIKNGAVRIEDSNPIFIPDHYKHYNDSLDKLITSGHADTILLFERALLYYLSNNVLTKPYPGDKAALKNLLAAKRLVDQATTQNMKSLKLKVLQAQIYRDITYRFGADESWQYSSAQIETRRKEFNVYKDFANGAYNNLAADDKANSYDYLRLVVKAEYPIK